MYGGSFVHSPDLWLKGPGYCWYFFRGKPSGKCQPSLLGAEEGPAERQGYFSDLSPCLTQEHAEPDVSRLGYTLSPMWASTQLSPMWLCQRISATPACGSSLCRVLR